MRFALVLAVVGCVATPVPCPVPGPMTASKSCGCCSTTKDCCCKGGDRPAPVPEPAAPAARSGHEQPADLAVATTGAGAPVAAAAGSCWLPRTAGFGSAPAYLSTCSFRC